MTAFGRNRLFELLKFARILWQLTACIADIPKLELWGNVRKAGVQVKWKRVPKIRLTSNPNGSDTPKFLRYHVQSQKRDSKDH